MLLCLCFARTHQILLPTGAEKYVLPRRTHTLDSVSFRPFGVFHGQLFGPDKTTTTNTTVWLIVWYRLGVSRHLYEYKPFFGCD